MLSKRNCLTVAMVALLFLCVGTQARAAAFGMALVADRLAVAAATTATTAKPTVVADKQKADHEIPRRNRLAPFPEGDRVAWSHAPYSAGACSICHERDDEADPGPVKGRIDRAVCFQCHEQMQETMQARTMTHQAAADTCTDCHNPHNSLYGKLLLEEPPQLCFGCHDDIKSVATNSAVQHDAVLKGATCINCHNPHAANVEHLLKELPYDLCVACHNKDNMKDSNGKILTNFSKLLADNPVHHSPVAAKDCSACHQVHGSANFRLLIKAYPEKFYASYAPENYALCFSCHNDQMLESQSATNLTLFRDGDRNLHYTHVHKDTNGRTCRACHEVHASQKPHQIRNAVPFGNSGWQLPVQYDETAAGGQCAKTCHTTRTYANRSVVSRTSR